MIRVALAGLRDVRRTWPQLVAADLATRVAATLLVVPGIGWVAHRALLRAGGGALTDEEILRFVLSPLGLVTVLFVGAASALAGLIGYAAIMAVLAGIEEQRAVSWLEGMRLAARRSVAIFRMTLRGLLRLLVDAAPFLLLAGGAYAALLTRYDINYYLIARPPSFWIAGLLILLAGAGIAWFAGRRLVGWTLALPRLLFGGASPARALAESARVTAGRRWKIVLLLLLWAGVAFAISSTLTGGAALVGRWLVPEGSHSLSAMVSGLAVAAVIGIAANLIVSVIGSITLAAFLFELDRRWSDSWTLPRQVTAEPGTLGRRASLRVPGWAWVVAAVLIPAGAVFLGAGLLDDIRVSEGVEVTAHRGASGRAPENTLAAVRAAIEDGADWVEVDVQETSDGVVIVHHDVDFMRQSRDARRVWNTPWATVAEIDNGSWFGPGFATERVATLEDVLLLARGSIGVNVELKVYGHGQRLEERTIALIESLRMQDQVVLMSLDRRTVERLNALRPTWTVGFLAAVSLGDLRGIDADFLAVNSATATPGFIRRADASGKQVQVWTIDHPAQMSAVISAGADVLITNEPALARRVLAELETLSAAERLLLVAGARFGIVPDANESSDEEDA
ncbi:MAG: glycerophosphodiester phosphodiesterase family protein [Gemmatimonadota bacterium]|nr:glycerophosphodiester phosphodiesterase family protein [Gemmatimonadota bacterium]